jgi:diguanylate cyclase (GGDEF)-like protein/putative nucleotidyltransferase with HDIG domain
MKELSLQAKTYIFGTILAGATLLIWNLYQVGIEDIWITLCLAGIASLALIFKVEGTTNRSHYNISFLVYGAALFLLGAPGAMLVILISNLVEWVWHKYPWYIQTFNIGCYIITTQIASLVFIKANPDHILFSWLGVITMLVSMAVFTIVNHLMVGIIVWLARGENFKQSGMFDFLPLMIDFTVLSMGAGAALIWTLDPVAIVFVVIPLYLIYSTLRVPSLERQTEIDPKTGVYNHRYFEKALENELSRAHRFDRPISVVMSDLDLLRNINNTYGHLAGDEVLIGVANILRDHAREYDIVSRFGGEEFALLLPETTAEEAFEIVENIRLDIENAEYQVPTSLTPIKATMSFGIASRENETQSAKEILHNADTAVYHSKLRGRNRTYVYTDQIYQGLFKPYNLQESETDILQEHLGFEVLGIPGDMDEQVSQMPIKPLVNENHGERPPQPSSPRPNRSVYLFILLISVISGGLLLLLLTPAERVSLPGLSLFIAIVFMAEWFSVDIYVRNTAVSVSAAPLLAGVILFGPAGAVLLSLSFALAAYLKHNSPPSRLVFNFSNQLLAGMLCLGFLHLTGIDYTINNDVILLIMSLLLGTILYISTTAMVTVAMYLSTGMPLGQTWKDQFSWLAPYYIVMGMIAYALVFGYTQAGMVGALVVTFPLLLLRFSQKQYLDRTRAIVSELKDKNVILEKSSKEISTLNEGLLRTLAEVVDLRDPFVLGHSQQVTHYAVQMAIKLGLSKEQVQRIHKAGLLHDIGKLGVPERILLKPSRLTPEEYEIVKEHVVLGAEILEASQSLHNLIPIIRHHHERYDGKGYPDGLSGEDIPIEARIVAVADAVEAMASDRPYRRALELEHILHELNNNAGTQFDPQVVIAFNEIASQAGSDLVVNSARSGINLRLHSELDEIYHNLLKDRMEEKVKPGARLDEDIQSVSTTCMPNFSFTTLPRQN